MTTPAWSWGSSASVAGSSSSVGSAAISAAAASAAASSAAAAAAATAAAASRAAWAALAVSPSSAMRDERRVASGWWARAGGGGGGGRGGRGLELARGCLRVGALFFFDHHGNDTLVSQASVSWWYYAIAHTVHHPLCAGKVSGSEGVEPFWLFEGSPQTYFSSRPRCLRELDNFRFSEVYSHVCLFLLSAMFSVWV